MYYMTAMHWNWHCLNDFNNTYTKWLGFSPKKPKKILENLENVLTNMEIMPGSMDYVTEHKGKI